MSGRRLRGRGPQPACRGLTGTGRFGRRPQRRPDQPPVRRRLRRGRPRGGGGRRTAAASVSPSSSPPAGPPRMPSNSPAAGKSYRTIATPRHEPTDARPPRTAGGRPCSSVRSSPLRYACAMTVRSVHHRGPRRRTQAPSRPRPPSPAVSPPRSARGRPSRARTTKAAADGRRQACPPQPGPCSRVRRAAPRGLSRPRRAGATAPNSRRDPRQPADAHDGFDVPFRGSRRASRGCPTHTSHAAL